jgi:hypothetical protein
MRKVLILVEGQTEKELVTRVLAPHLSRRDVWAQPKVLTTKRVRSGPDYKGGVSSYALVKDDIDRLLKDTSAAIVTTMIDFYGLPRDFPGWSDAPRARPVARVAHVEAAWRKNVAHARFEPHLVLHETEAFIFSDPMACEVAFPNVRSREALASIGRAFVSPEDIDEGPATAPSKRIIEVLPDFDKVVLGPLAVEEIGLEVVRSRCPHFDGWLRRLEALGDP